MTYYTGSVAAVPQANRQAYIDHATKAWPLFRESGALRMIETWGEDVQPGEHTDFQGAVAAKGDEGVVFSWIEWPDKATADAAWQKMSTDPAIAGQMGEMPFDGKRMIFGGFAPIFEKGTDKGAGWIQGFLVPVPAANRDAYVEMAGQAWTGMFEPHGCIGTVEAWGNPDEVPRGQVTDFYRAVKAEDGEAICFSWTAWPDRATCDAAAKAMEADFGDGPPPEMPFDGKRMIWGGFAPIFDSDKG